jgi:phosphinothricin acetyltransferase
MATINDSEDILKIYGPFISDTVISFETEIPSVLDFSRRIENIVKKYPFIIYEIDNNIVGYTYASQHRERAAYAFDVDVSIYVLSEYHGLGIAYKLYECLFILLKKLGYKNAYAAYTEPNIKSMKFHQKFNFKKIGTHHKTGYKFGQWHDVTWVEKTIDKHETILEKPILMESISLEYLTTLFKSYT